MSEQQYEYLPLKRSINHDAPNQWHPVRTGRGAGRPYRTVGAARGVMSREKRRDEERLRAWATWGGVWGPYEYKIQRRPVPTVWEDFE